MYFTDENAVQDIDGVNVAGVHAEQDDPLIQPVGGGDEALARTIPEKCLAWGKKILLGWQDGAVVFQPRIRPTREPPEDVLAVLLHRRVQLAELLDDGCEKIELTLSEA